METAPESEAQLRYRQMMESGDPFAIHAMGILAHQQGRDDVAVEAIGKAIALDPAIPRFHYNLGLVLRAQNRLPEAAASYERALALKPDYAEAHNNLGNILVALGKTQEARERFTHALSHRPDFAEAHYSLANLLRELGEPDAARAHFEACLECDPGDGMGAAMLLAALGAGETPPRASEAHLQNTYAQRASSWNRENQYRGHELVAQALRQCASRAELDILDAGCGTGLVGTLVRGLARRLDGVDLSAPMLEQAAQKQLYDHLYQEDLVSFLRRHPRAYDAIACAATLIHFGDLAPAFHAAAAALREDGLFVFTLFPGEDGGTDFAVAPDAELAKGGCFVHHQDYVARLAEATGFAVELLARETHEHDRSDAPVSGLVVALRRS